MSIIFANKENSSIILKQDFFFFVNYLGLLLIWLREQH